VGKLKKVGIGIGVIVVIYIIVIGFGFCDSCTGPLSSNPSGIISDELYDNMDDESLEMYSVDWNYRDMQRNIDNYKGKIIFVQGTVSNIQPDIEVIAICEKSAGNSCDVIFIDTPDRYLIDDEISGYVEVIRLSSGDELLPAVHDVSLTCSNC